MVRFSLLVAIVLQLVVISSQDEKTKPEEKDKVLLDIRMQFKSSARINDQINKEFKASYMYEAMTSYFGRPSVGLPGFKKFFKKAADEEREHGHKLIDYLNKRGGNVMLNTTIDPYIDKLEWLRAIDAVKDALVAEKDITTALYSLRKAAEDDEDPLLVDFIETEFLSEQVDGISYLRELIAKLERVSSSGLGEYMIDKELL